jgi:hypothetical protein
VKIIAGTFPCICTAYVIWCRVMTCRGEPLLVGFCRPTDYHTLGPLAPKPYTYKLIGELGAACLLQSVALLYLPVPMRMSDDMPHCRHTKSYAHAFAVAPTPTFDVQTGCLFGCTTHVMWGVAHIMLIRVLLSAASAELFHGLICFLQACWEPSSAHKASSWWGTWL